MKNIAILGSTGSIGSQTLEVISENKNKFKIVLLSANRNYKLLIEQAIKYKPETIIFGDINHKRNLEKGLKH